MRLALLIAITSALVALGSPPAASAATALSQPQVTLGFDFGCAVIPGGAVQCWGANGYGQLGDGTTTPRLSPVLVPGVGGAIAVSATQGGACALLSSETVKCWGWDGVTVRPAPATIAGIDGAVGITAGEVHTCVLLAGGAAKCWGQNQYGPLGDGTTADRAEPVTVVGLSGALQISAAGQTTCALLASGGVVCWGLSQTGATAAQVTPVPIAGVTGATAFATGRNSGSCAVIAGGAVQCWGASYSPGPVTMDGISGATAVVAGGLYDNYCAILAGGSVACWGANNYGQLGDGTTIDRYRTPVMTTGLSGMVSVAIGVGWTTCGARVDGELFCWGYNGNGELGNGTTTNSSTPTPVAPVAPGIALNAPSDLTIVATSPSGAAATFSASALLYPTRTPVPTTCSPVSGTVFPIGRTTVTCTATAGAMYVTARFAVNVVPPPDTTPPVVVLPPTVSLPGGGKGHLAEAAGPAGALSFSGGTVADLVDGPLPVTCRATDGSVFPLGTSAKPITCSATDSSGNVGSVASGAPRTVLVRDTTAPVIPNFPNGYTLTTEATSRSGAVAQWSIQTADAVDGQGFATCLPASGATFPLGNTVVTCDATDRAGNRGASVFFTVAVVDTTPPEAFLFPTGNFSAEATGPDGAESFVGGSTNDLVDGAVPVTCAAANGRFFPLGLSIIRNISRQIICTATDAAGNIATRTLNLNSRSYQTIEVTDRTPPVIAAHADVTVMATGPAGAVVTYTAPETMDLVDGPGVATCDPAPGATFPVGTTTVTCSTADSRDNTATSTFTVTVVGPQQAIRAVMDAVTASAASSGKRDADKLTDVAKKLERALAPKAWADAVTLTKDGQHVFEGTREAASKLSELLSDKKSLISDATLREWIAQLVQADRGLARSALDRAAGVDGKKVAEAEKDFAAGDAAGASEPHRAIEHYRKAWQRVS